MFAAIIPTPFFDVKKNLYGLLSQQVSGQFLEVDSYHIDLVI